MQNQHDFVYKAIDFVSKISLRTTINCPNKYCTVLKSNSKTFQQKSKK